MGQVQRRANGVNGVTDVASMETAIEQLAWLGVKFGYIPEMRSVGCYVQTQNVALFREGLSGQEREEAARLMLASVLTHQLAPQAR